MNSNLETKSLFDEDSFGKILSFTFDAMEQGITFYDKNLRLLAWNKRFEQMEIFPPEEIEYGRDLLNYYQLIAKNGIFGPGDPERLAQEHIDEIKRGVFKRFEVLYPPTGRIIEIQRYAFEPFGIVAVFNDVTDIKIQESRAQGQNKLAAIGYVSRILAHDFNNQLSILRSCLEMLEIQSQNTDADDLIVQSLQSCQDCENIIREMALQTDLNHATRTNINLSEWLESKKRRFGLLIKRGIEFEICANLNDSWINVAENQLEFALINLIKNANEAMPNSMVEVILHYEHLKECKAKDLGISTGDYIKITVSDDGIGVDPNQLTRIFDPFVTTKKSNYGNGIGLAQVQNFTQVHGGCCEIVSEKNKGTEITMWLPQNIDIEQDNNQHGYIGYPPLENKDQNGKIVWVIDDNIELARLLVRALRGKNYLARAFFDVDRFMDQYETIGETPDLILSDIKLNGSLDGIELAQWLLDKQCPAKMLLMTGYHEEFTKRIRETTALKDIAVIAKPFSINDLILIMTDGRPVYYSN